MAIDGKGAPSQSDAIQSHFESLIGKDATGSEFRFTFTKKYNAWRERVAWLRVAYLYLTALLGYTFVLREVLNPIREQFQRPDERLVPQLIRKIGPPLPDDFMVAIFEPKELRAFGVKLGEWMYFLPGFEESDTFFDRFSSFKEAQAPSLVGRPLEFPDKPAFLCDFHPELAGRLLSPKASDGAEQADRWCHSPRGIPDDPSGSLGSDGGVTLSGSVALGADRPLLVSSAAGGRGPPT